MTCRAVVALGFIAFVTGCVGAPTAPNVTQNTARVPDVVPTPPPPAATLVLSGAAKQGALLRGTVPPMTQALRLDGRPVALAPDGRFMIGFGRDAPPNARLVATLTTGAMIMRDLIVAPRTWPLETISGLPRFALPSATLNQRRPAELAQIAAARATMTNAQGWRQPFRWPAIGRISGVFGSQRVYANGEKGDYHSGVDIAGAAGTPVVAPADGVVILAADHPFTLEGNLLMIDHGMSLNSAFLHLSRIDVRVGQVVRQGQLIGAIGMTGRATGPHLHWSMKWQDARLDPQALAGPVR